jgi:hypothetical protein
VVLLYLISKKNFLYVRFIQKFHSGWAFSAFIIGCGGYKFSFGLVGRRFWQRKKIALFGLIATHTIIDWINIVFCFSAWFCFSWTNV